jgi:hypothetical protein
LRLDFLPEFGLFCLVLCFIQVPLKLCYSVIDVFLVTLYFGTVEIVFQQFAPDTAFGFDFGPDSVCDA